MCIYCGTTKYRKIYQYHYGPIPKDEQGRSYDIHHIDGNNKNNSPDNLQAVSIKEHLSIHELRGDWAACFRISQRMGLDPTVKKEYARRRCDIQLAEGVHNFQRPDVIEKTRQRIQSQLTNGSHPLQDRQAARKRALNRVADGTHHLLDREAASRRGKARVMNGTCNLLGGSQQRAVLAAGKHPSQIDQTCPHCGLIGKASAMKRWHFDNCRTLKPIKSN